MAGAGFCEEQGGPGEAGAQPVSAALCGVSRPARCLVIDCLPTIDCSLDYQTPHCCVNALPPDSCMFHACLRGSTAHSDNGHIWAV